MKTYLIFVLVVTVMRAIGLLAHIGLNGYPRYTWRFMWDDEIALIMQVSFALWTWSLL